MPSPESLATLVTNCMGGVPPISVPGLEIEPPDLTIPPLNLSVPEIHVPKVTVPKIPSLNIPYQWPTITDPGYTAMVAGFAGSLLAGIDYVKSFIPPDPQNLPNIPDISLFIKGFIGAAPGLPQLPPLDIKIPGVPSIPFPGMPGNPLPLKKPTAPQTVKPPKVTIPPLNANVPEIELPQKPDITIPALPDVGFDPSAMMNMVGMYIVTPFLLIKKIIESILSLSLQIPGFQMILDLLKGIASSIGFPAATVDHICPCAAKMATNVLSVLG